MGRLMHLMMHVKFRVHVRLDSMGIRLTVLLIIHQSYTPLCRQLAPTHTWLQPWMSFRETDTCSCRAHTHTHTHVRGGSFLCDLYIDWVSACIYHQLKWCMLTVVTLPCERCMLSANIHLPMASCRLSWAVCVKGQQEEQREMSQ